MLVEMATTKTFKGTSFDTAGLLINIIRTHTFPKLLYIVYVTVLIGVLFANMEIVVGLVAVKGYCYCIVVVVVVVVVCPVNTIFLLFIVY